MKGITITLDISQVPILVDIIRSLPNQDEIVREILNQCSSTKPAIPHITRRKREWLDQPLGDATDREIAKKMGVTHQRVQQVRESLGIATLHKNKIEAIDWKAQPLGQVSDIDLSGRLGVSQLTIKRKRDEKNIPSFGHYDWNNIPLGQMTDSHIAAIIGGTTSNVNHVRRKRGIPAFRPLGTTNWDEQPLGQVTDKELAGKLGVSVSCVYQHRTQRQIPSLYTTRSGRIITGAKAVIQADWDNLPLGKVTDQEIADLVGCSTATVKRRREERNIPPSRKRKSTRLQ